MARSDRAVRMLPVSARAAHRCRAPREACSVAAGRSTMNSNVGRQCPISPRLRIATARLVRSLVMTVLRRLGTLRHLLHQWLELPAGAPRVETALLLGAAQILWLDVADHAAVDLAVRLVQAEHLRRATPVSSMPCCGASRARAGISSPPSTWPRSTPRSGCWHAGKEPMEPKPRARSPSPTRRSRRSI